MKNFNILGVHGKIRVLGGEGFTKNQYIGGMDSLQIWGGRGLGKRGWCFWGGVAHHGYGMSGLLVSRFDVTMFDVTGLVWL